MTSKGTIDCETIETLREQNSFALSKLRASYKIEHIKERLLKLLGDNAWVFTSITVAK